MLQGSAETPEWEGLKDLDEALEGLEELISGIVDARESPYLQELHVDAHAHVPIDSTAARLTLKLVEKLQNLIRKEEVNDESQ